MSTRILIVDDHPLTREALVVAARRSTASTSPARPPTARQAIERARGSSRDLVLLDLSMPGIGRPRRRCRAPRRRARLRGRRPDRLRHRGEPARRDPRRRRRLPAEDRAAGADRRVPATASRNGEAALSGAIARRLLDQVRDGRAPRRRARRDRRAALRPRGRGAAPARRPPRHRRDRAAPLHLRAHRPLAREEPAAQARRLVAPRGARGASRARPRG